MLVLVLETVEKRFRSEAKSVCRIDVYVMAKLINIVTDERNFRFLSSTVCSFVWMGLEFGDQINSKDIRASLYILG